MHTYRMTLAALALLAGAPCFAQQASQPQIHIAQANRTLSVSAEGRITAEPEIAILHLGFETKPQDAKSAYADGATTSNAIVAALKQAGIPEGAIRSERQYLQRDYQTAHKFTLVQSWTVKAPAARAAEILDVAMTAGANSTGEIEWTMNDPKALDVQALEQAAKSAQEDAAALAKAMNARLGALVYVSRDQPPQVRPMMASRGVMAMAKADNAPPLAIEPQQVIRTATVYAVYAIE
ncbi:MAG TPA: SIMPL domain-containing protein [Xanthobacteraceae bacterium]